MILYLHNVPTCKETLLYCMRGFGFSCVLYMFAWVPCLVFNVYAVFSEVAGFIQFGAFTIYMYILHVALCTCHIV